VRGAALLASRTGWREIDTRFADFSRSVSPGKHFLAGRLPGLHHIVEPPTEIRPVVQENLTSRNIPIPTSHRFFRRLGVDFPNHPDENLNSSLHIVPAVLTWLPANVATCTTHQDLRLLLC
jgi:hypothetical protein